MNQCYQHIRPVRDAFCPRHANIHGVVKISSYMLEGLFGLPHFYTQGLQHTIEYYILTPRGVAVVRDHWANPESVYNLLSEDKRAVKWLASFFNKHGAQARVITQRNP